MRSLSDAIEAEDAPAIASCFSNDNDPQNAFGNTLARRMVAEHHYWKSLCSTFGRETAIDAYRTRGIVLPDAYVEFPDADWQIKGDEAFKPYKKGGPYAPGPLKRVDGQWYIDMMRRPTPKQLAAFTQKQEQAAKQLETLSADVAAGKFRDVHAAIDVLYPRKSPSRRLNRRLSSSIQPPFPAP